MVDSSSLFRPQKPECRRLKSAMRAGIPTRGTNHPTPLRRRFLFTCAVVQETCVERGRPLDKLPLVIFAVAVAETAWALLCAYTGINIFVFYAVLVIASGVFWVPGLTEGHRASQKTRPDGTAETDG